MESLKCLLLWSAFIYDTYNWTLFIAISLQSINGKIIYKFKNIATNDDQKYFLWI